MDIYNSKNNLQKKIKNNNNEINHYFNKIKNKKGITVVFEPTGCYHQRLVRYLNDKEFDYFFDTIRCYSFFK